MADEITANIFVQTDHPGMVVQFSESEQFDMSGDHWNGGKVDVSTTEAALDLGNVATAGLTVLKADPDNTENVLIGVKPSGTFLKCFELPPGKVAQVWFPNAIYHKVTTATQKLHYVVLES